MNAALFLPTNPGGSKDEGPVSEVHFHAMGTEIHLICVRGSSQLMASAVERIRYLESLWSRFLEDSEVSVLNRSAGRPQIVTDETLALVERSIEAWRLSDGCFNPCVEVAMAANGYDRDFKELELVPPRVPSGRAAPSPQEIVVLHDTNIVILPAGVRIDAGGIGKGLAADYVVDLLISSGATGALVNVGGDVRVAGDPSSEAGWVISIPHPLQSGVELIKFRIEDGAVATSSRLKRRWRTSNGMAHHLLNPLTGQPMVTKVVAASVIAATGWQAEAYTKLIFMRGITAAQLPANIHALAVLDDGRFVATRGVEEMVE